MTEFRPAQCPRFSLRDRQMLAVAYVPVIVFAAVLIAARIPGKRRHPLQAALR